jgi:hypothetical protein
MTEQDIKDLNFDYHEAEIDGLWFHYYTYDCGNKYGTLFSSDSDVSGQDGWYVLFGDSSEFRFYEKEEVEKLIPILEKAYTGDDLRNFKLEMIIRDYHLK